MRQYILGLSSEPIVTGAYEGFRQGDVVLIPLGFYFPDNYSLTLETTKRVVHVRDDLYDVNAEVLYAHGANSVIDFGLRAASFAAPDTSQVAAGEYVSGTTRLTVEYAGRSEMRTPDGRTIPLAYLWRVDRIQVVTGKRIPSRDPRLGPVLVPDETTFTYHEIEDTRPILYHPMLLDEFWPYRDPFICVLLHCTLLQDEPVAGP